MGVMSISPVEALGLEKGLALAVLLSLQCER